MSEKIESKCPDPPYFRFWLLIIITLLLGWILGNGILKDLLWNFNIGAPC